MRASCTLHQYLPYLIFRSRTYALMAPKTLDRHRNATTLLIQHCRMISFRVFRVHQLFKKNIVTKYICTITYCSNITRVAVAGSTKIYLLPIAINPGTKSGFHQYKWSFSVFASEEQSIKLIATLLDNCNRLTAMLL